ncbi:hypothetical protein TcCL_Unassigned02188 [Trypanosoma cruzi]|nr:hypothetical protein TcCL_Unassigned02188 [Trypanosoma cruzi]
MHTTCTRTTATTASGCHSLSTVLEKANNNNTVVSAEGSSTHSARHGLTPLWHRRHRTHSARGRADINLTRTNPKVGGEFGKAAATRKNHKSYTPQQRCIMVIPYTTEKSATCILYGKYLRCAWQKSAVTLPFILHSPFTYHWEARSHHSSVPLPFAKS